MNARMYVLNSDVKIPELKGQAKIVMDGLVGLQSEGPRLAVDIDKVVGPNLKTRQDTLRVTLYYIIIFKGKGLVRAVETSATVAENAFAGVDMGDCE